MANTDYIGNAIQQTERMYTYHARTNRVASTTGAGIDYRYNPSGNMSKIPFAGTRSETAHEDGQIDLGWDIFLNLPAEVTHPVWEQSQGTTHFAYGSNRQRVVKQTQEDGETNVTYYVHGLSAHPLSVTHCIDVAVRNECWAVAYIWGPDGLIAEHHSHLGQPADEMFAVKDHLGSIRLIVDADDGTVRAWQDYAPFGEVMRGADISASLRYTYTGQEADTELGLMNYQARLYDPEIGIFLASDPAGQIAASYAYAGNNPISFVDPDGEFFLEAMAIFAAVNLTADALRGNINSFGDAMFSLGLGAIQGAMAATGASAVTSVGSAFVAAVSSQIPAVGISVGPARVGIKPAFSFGTHGFKVGGDVIGGMGSGSVQAAGGFGLSYTMGGPRPSSLFNFDVGVEGRTFLGGGYYRGLFHMSYFETEFTDPGQRVGGISIGYGAVTFRHDNDLIGDGGDRFRTAAAYFELFGMIQIGTTLYTGDPGLTQGERSIDPDYPGSPAGAYRGGSSIDPRYRMGALYLGYRSGSNVYRVGVEGDPIRHAIQNVLIHKHFLGLFGNPSPYFIPTDGNIRGFTQFMRYSPFTLY